MARFTAMVQIRLETFERLDAVRKTLSSYAGREETAYSIGAALEFLIRHVDHVTPDREWVMAQLESLPKRGKPKHNEDYLTVGDALGRKHKQAHDLRKAGSSFPGGVICIACGQKWSRLEGFEQIGLCRAKRDDMPEALRPTLQLGEDYLEESP